MKSVTWTGVIKASSKSIFATMTNNVDYTWRTDIEKIIVHDTNHFTEYDKFGHQTDFTIIKIVPDKEYAFTMKNKKFTGSWIGILEEIDDHTTKLTLTESVSITNPLLRILSLFVFNLQKMQETYVKDLKKRVELL